MLTAIARRLALISALALFLSVPAASAVAQDEGHGEETVSHTEDQDSGHDADPAGHEAGDDDAAHEEHGGGHEEEHGVIGSISQGAVSGITAIIVFVVVLFILSKLVWPKIQSGLDEREKKIRDEIESAEDARKQAKDALDSYERSLGEARAEAQQMLEQAKSDQQKLTAELKGKAEVELGAMKEKAKRDIETAKRAAISEIYNEAATLATAVAGKILAREVSSDDQQRFVQEAVAELNSAGQ